MKKITKKAIKTGIFIAGFYLLNTVGASLAFKECALQPEDFGKITGFMKTSSYVYDYQGTEEEKTIKYLKLAHIITMNNITVQNVTSKDNRKKDLLDERIGDCSETSKYTYANYLSLIKSANLVNLAKYVRYASGYLIDSANNQRGGHAWLEIMIDKVWRAYETTAFDIPNGIDIDPAKVPDVVMNKIAIDLPLREYKKEFYIQIMPDGKIKSGLNTWNCLKNYEGLTGALIRKWISKD
jgi:hypothetical protein